MGKYCGKTRWSVNNRKTTEGSFYGVLSMIVSYTIIIYFLYNPYISYVSIHTYKQVIDIGDNHKLHNGRHFRRIDKSV